VQRSLVDAQLRLTETEEALAEAAFKCENLEYVMYQYICWQSCSDIYHTAASDLTRTVYYPSLPRIDLSHTKGLLEVAEMERDGAKAVSITISLSLCYRSCLNGAVGLLFSAHDYPYVINHYVSNCVF
jgi:hypothetical protein